MSATFCDTQFVARITPGGRGYDVVELTEGQDGRVLIALHVRHHDGMVTWSNNWGVVPDLIRAGVCHSVSRGPETYGHVDVYFV